MRSPVLPFPRMTALAVCAAFAFASPLAAHDHGHSHSHDHGSHQHGAHEHGVADLRVALDDGTLLVEFDSPMDNIVGFEYAPQTEAQMQALADAEVRLRDFASLFSVPGAAGCVIAEVQLESPYSETHDHDHDHDHAHADLYVVYQLECANPSALDAIEIGLAEAFPRIHTIRVETATPSGQGATRLDRSGSRIPL
ncbi:MAG TPA: DUF2796 domain-containing protein [Azoarcus taiwanensis]|nr:DUF2796 domain-containing protein [Azoarcus taiwanensis]